MAVPRVHLMLVSLNINDEPVGYSPPVGPASGSQFATTSAMPSHPSNFNYSNLGPKWTFDWLSYITDDPSNPLADVRYYIMGGGTRTFKGSTVAPRPTRSSNLIRPGSPARRPNSYEMISRDGTRKVFSQRRGPWV